MQPSRRLSFAAFIIALTFLAGPAHGQAPLELGKRVARSKYALGRIVTAQELPDGRVVVADGKEQVFRLVDLGRGEVTLLGKPGDGADAYRAASALFALPGDSLGLYDAPGRKIIRVTPQGTIGATTVLPAVTSGRRLGTMLGADPNGQLYFTLPEQFDTGTTATSGLTRITRFNAESGADEPLMTVRSRRDDQRQITGVMPYFFRDAVAIRRDGLVARVVADTYQVIWLRDGKETGRTGPIAHPPIAITVAEQAAIKDSVAGSVKSMFGGNGPGTTTTTAGLPPGVSVTSFGGGSGARTTVSSGSGGSSAPMVFTNPGGGSVVQQYTPKNPDGSPASPPLDMNSLMDKMANQPLGAFPDVKPPFVSNVMAARFDAVGNLWVARERVHGDLVPHYDVIAEGKGVIAHVNLPVGSRLVGFGKNALYLARNEDGSDWLERYAMPTMP